jgi:hypothetical protein
VKPLKRILSPAIALSLLILTATVVLGAVHSNEGERFRTDTWYTVNPNVPYIQTGLNRWKSSYTASDFIWGEFYQNDHTFFTFAVQNFDYREAEPMEHSEICGSFLLHNGFFLGVSNLSDEYYSPSIFPPGSTRISPGYRYSFHDNNYIALSLDYLNRDDHNDIFAYELNWRYYDAVKKLACDLYTIKDDHSYFRGEAVFQLTDRLAGGFNLARELGLTKLDIGTTWNLDPFILDAQYTKDTDNDRVYSLNGMFNLSDRFGTGALYQKYDNIAEPQYTVFVKYATGHEKFKLAYSPQNGNWMQTYSVSYFMTLQ